RDVSDAVARALDAALGGAVGATEEAPVGLDPVADDLAAAVRALGRQGVNGALEAVEDVRPPRELHFERLVVVVSADFTDWHGLRRLHGNRRRNKGAIQAS